MNDKIITEFNRLSDEIAESTSDLAELENKHEKARKVIQQRLMFASSQLSMLKGILDSQPNKT